MIREIHEYKIFNKNALLTAAHFFLLRENKLSLEGDLTQKLHLSFVLANMRKF